MDVFQEIPGCGTRGQPLDDRHTHGESRASASREGRRVEYVVVGQRGATASYQAVEDSSRTYKTGAAELAEQLGIDESSLVGCRFNCWVEPAEYDVIRRDYRPS
ncbi:hypothetical protein GCM10029978_011710 [Actinoallomurus acanthiterrae]